MIVGAASEMWALDRASGRVLWRIDVTKGTSVVTPGGVARLGPDGTLAVHDFGNGEVTLRARIAPRIGGPVAGAVVHLPGLPKPRHRHRGRTPPGRHRPHERRASLALVVGRRSRAGGPSRGAPRMKRAGSSSTSPAAMAPSPRWT